MKNFKLYRKLVGGNWFYNRYIFDLGRTVIYKFEKSLPNYGWGYNVEQYNEVY